MKDKLIKLIEEKQIYGIDQAQKNNRDILLLDNEELADHLIANGVVVIDTDVVSAENRPLISTLAGYPINEVIDLMQAKQEGRVIVTPCKVGYTMYVIYRGIVQPVKVNAIRFDTKKNNHRICVWGTFHIYEYYSHEYKATFPFDSIGKTIFLTREEAEKALADITNKKN